MFMVVVLLYWLLFKIRKFPFAFEWQMFLYGLNNNIYLQYADIFEIK